MSKIIQKIKDKGHTIKGFAKILGIQTNMIYLWANKYTPRGKYLAKICALLDCKIDDLLHDDDNRLNE